jgi:8-hydroxy-5-deazaflavin:NADPH oxidoreductase
MRVGILGSGLMGGNVVSAFNTVPSEVLFGVFESRKRSRPSFVYCGDDDDAKEVAAGLIRDVGVSRQEL